jgi:tetratricopeptide (TPR) repeat protein
MHVVFPLLACALLADTAHADSVPLRRKTEAERLFDRGRDALAKNDYVAAESAFNESLKLDGKVVGAMLGLAQVAARRGDRAAYAANLQRAITLAPDSSEVQYAWGRYQYSLNKFTEAEKAYRSAIRLDAQAVGPRIDLADLYATSLAKPAEAIPLYKEVIARDPKHAGAHYALGVAFAATSDDESAMRAFTEAATLAPDNPFVPYELGRLHIRHERWDAALDAFARAITIRPSFVAAYFDRADIWATRQQPDKVLAELNAAVKAAPKSADAFLRLGMAYQHRSRWPDAEAAYRATLALDPNRAMAYNNLAWMAAERRVRLDEAVGWAKAAVKLKPGVSQFQTTLGWVLRAQGDLVKADETLAKAAASKPERAEAFYYLGIVESDRGHRAEAARSLRKALSLNPNFAGADDAKNRLKALG